MVLSAYWQVGTDLNIPKFLLILSKITECDSGDYYDYNNFIL